MSLIVRYEDVNISVNEDQKIILINPLSERFYTNDDVYEKATLLRLKEENGEDYYAISGRIRFVNVFNNETERNYNKLLLRAPAELIKKKIGIFGGIKYVADGVMHRELDVIYNCKHGTNYQIIERTQILSTTFQSVEAYDAC
ncbi:MAG: hypothetical protein M1300_06970 [Epsilonproteobacteria bacterium]|nr:hypothetical protein [Campylobacterota bacterium]